MLGRTLHWGCPVLWEDGLPGLHGFTARKPEATDTKSADVGSVSSWGSLLGLLVSLLGGLVVMESRRVSGRQRSLLSLWSRCCASGGLSSCYGVAFCLDVLQEERLVSLKVGL